MLDFLLRRFFTAIPVLAIVSLISFGIMRLIPGDPAQVMAGVDASKEQVALLRSQLLLDRPMHEQLLNYYKGLAVGDLGNSLTYGADVLQIILDRLPITLSLGLYSLLITLPIGIGLGVVAAVYRNSWLDTLFSGVALFGLSVPNFWLGMMGVLLFSVHFGWLPSSGYVPISSGVMPWLASLTLPAAVLATSQIGLLARISRSAMLDVLRQDFVRTARAKGAGEIRTIGLHALGNASIPIVTVIGMIVSLMVTGGVVTEQVFALPGVGRLVIQSILSRDYPVVQGVLLLSAAGFVIINLLVDMLYTILDPRVSYD